jgi:hypothetical protein
MVGFGPQLNAAHQIILQIQDEKSEQGHTIAQIVSYIHLTIIGCIFGSASIMRVFPYDGT